MKFDIPFSRIDVEREKAATKQGEVDTYQADEKLRAELTERMEKKREEMIKARDREYALSGSLGKKRHRHL